MLFIEPKPEAFRHPTLMDIHYMESHGARTYAEYNYLGGGLSKRFKRSHFERALMLSRDAFGRANVIDFGCADGVFLPSLSHYFKSVIGIDVRDDFIRIANIVIQNLSLDNVELLCNFKKPFDYLKETTKNKKFDMAFCLEVLEHVGESNMMYENQIDLVGDIFSLLDSNGKIIVSVPKMVGFAFMLQRLALAALDLQREPVSTMDIFRAGLLRSTDHLESRWRNNHIGFNHLKLEAHLRKQFHIVKKTQTLFQVLYIIQCH
ncbi:class I SAM-dependent methyltransferase [Desulfobulbus sp. F5]|nr:class I SAM-dependent methyltransferase [Desulfobulbus sp. F5]